MLANVWVKRIGVGVCSMSLFSTPIVSFANPLGAANAHPVAANDIAIGPNGTLTGIVTDASGRAKGGEIVTVGFAGAEVAAVQTLEDGRFTIEGLREGSHVVTASGAPKPVRFWQARNAPPTAESDIALVSGQVPAGGQGVTPLVPVQPPNADEEPNRRRFAWLGRAFANYPILTTAAIFGAGVGTGLAIGLGIDSNPATP